MRQHQSFWRAVRFPPAGPDARQRVVAAPSAIARVRRPALSMAFEFRRQLTVILTWDRLSCVFLTDVLAVMVCYDALLYITLDERTFIGFPRRDAARTDRGFRSGQSRTVSRFVHVRRLVRHGSSRRPGGARSGVHHTAMGRGDRAEAADHRWSLAL